MTTLTLVVLAVVFVAAGIVLIRSIPAMQAYFKYRGKRIITCPETLHKEAVEVAMGTAAASAFVGGADIHLKECSRWPTRHDCGQECLGQIEADPDNCLLWNIVSSWYEGKSCVFCHKHFGALHHLDHVPALMGPDRKTVEWNRFEPQHLADVFEKYEPVCWNCHIAETFRQEHPELVVDRHR